MGSDQPQAISDLRDIGNGRPTTTTALTISTPSPSLSATPSCGLPSAPNGCAESILVGCRQLPDSRAESKTNTLMLYVAVDWTDEEG